jgi:cytochrome bd-type quinol oxidase subunit 1
MAEKRLEEEKKPVSLWWMFVPVLLGVAGGWVAWRVHKKKEEQMARIMLIIGIVFTIVIVPFYIWLLMLYL